MNQLSPRTRRRFLVAVMAMLLVVASSMPAGAVQFGEPDENEHPHVGLLVFDVDEAPTWRCSGTLLSPTVVLTAGHCTFGATGGRIWFEPDIFDSPAAEEYPFPGESSVEFAEVHTHPDYDDDAFFLFDVGVVILSEAVNVETYGSLADVGLLDELAIQRGLQERSFTVVGYGLQSVVPTLQADLVRHQGEVQLIDVRGTAGIPTGTSATFTNNPGEGNGSGGTCFGDSGGPTFVGDTNIIAAITSFGLNANCAGIGGAYRVDTAGDQEFINEFLD